MKIPFRWISQALLVCSIFVSSQAMARLDDQWQLTHKMKLPQPVSAIGIAPAEQLAVVAVGTNLQALNLDSGQVAWKITEDGALPGEAYRSVRFSPDGKFLAAGVEKQYKLGGLVLFDMATKQKLKAVDIDADPTVVSFSPDGGKVAVGLSDSRVIIYGTPDLAEVKVLEGLSSIPKAMLWSKDGKSLQVTAGWYTNENISKLRDMNTENVWERTQAETMCWNIENGEHNQLQPLVPGGPNVVYNEQGTMLATMSGQVHLRRGVGILHETWDGKELSVYEVSPSVQSKPKLVTTQKATSLLFRNASWPVMTWTPDGQTLVYVARTDNFFFWNGTEALPMNNPSWSYENPNSKINLLAFSSKGNRFIAAGGLALRVWHQKADSSAPAPANDVVF